MLPVEPAIIYGCCSALSSDPRSETYQGDRQSVRSFAFSMASMPALPPPITSKSLPWSLSPSWCPRFLLLVAVSLRRFGLGLRRRWWVAAGSVCVGTPHPGMPQVVLKKTEEAIEDSDIVLFMVDARQGVTEADRHYARCSNSSSGNSS